MDDALCSRSLCKGECLVKVRILLILRLSGFWHLNYWFEKLSELAWNCTGIKEIKGQMHFRYRGFYQLQVLACGLNVRISVVRIIALAVTSSWNLNTLACTGKLLCSRLSACSSLWLFQLSVLNGNSFSAVGTLVFHGGGGGKEGGGLSQECGAWFSSMVLVLSITTMMEAWWWNKMTLRLHLPCFRCLRSGADW